MTAVQEASVGVQRDLPKPGRTFAMTVVSVGCAAMVAAWAYFLLILVLPVAAHDPSAPALAALSVVFIAIFAGLGAISAFWSGARRRRRFWLVTAAAGLLVLLVNAPYVPNALADPIDTGTFLVVAVVVGAGLVIITGGIASFLDVRRGTPTWRQTGRAGWLLTGGIGVLVGAAATSLLAGLASADAATVAEAPTTTGVVSAENTRFVVTGLRMRNGEVLGLFVVNRDGIWHAFDIDSLGIHVQLPPNSTTAIAIKPDAPGNLQFYCSIPGHKAAGMVGTITVQ